MKHWTDKDLADALKEMRIIVDTREQVNDHVTAAFTKNKVQWFNRKLDIGDYSAQLGEDTFEKSVVIERKHNLDELCGNMTADRDRFEREFLRAKAYSTKVFLLIEEASWDDVFLGNYRSKLSPKSLLASLI
ncbi:MAG: nuclease, partial [Exiguobacterium sp.]|nr:nuclease [Exiguobacterium sp.]